MKTAAIVNNMKEKTNLVLGIIRRGRENKQTSLHIIEICIGLKLEYTLTFSLLSQKRCKRTWKALENGNKND